MKCYEKSRLIRLGIMAGSLASVVCSRSRAILADMGLEPGVGIQNFLFVMGTAFIEDDVADHDQKLLALSGEAAR